MPVEDDLAGPHGGGGDCAVAGRRVVAGSGDRSGAFGHMHQHDQFLRDRLQRLPGQRDVQQFARRCRLAPHLRADERDVIFGEGRGDCGGVDYALVGMGINLSQKKEDFPPELQNVAISLGEVL